METSATGVPIAYYVYGLGLISRESATAIYQTYHYDLRGSTLKLTNATGLVSDTYLYGPYGELASSTGVTANPFRYDGRDGVMTEANGLYYMRARYYLPEVKRFVNRDSLLGSVTQMLTLNRFAYVNGNPVGFIDPSGMFGWEGSRAQRIWNRSRGKRLLNSGVSS
jgi:RHS repeat-associated protein